MLFFVLGALLGAAGVAVVFLWRQGRLTAETARLTAQLGAAERALDEERATRALTQAQVRETFAALSQDALRDNRDDFMHRATALLSPMKETLGRVQAQLADADKAREGSYRAVATQLSSVVSGQQELHAATEGLTRSLRSSNVRGKWGEVQLRRIVELAGMIERCDFFEKESTTTEAGARQTPDLIVRLPGDATVVIDAKVAIDGFLAASNATTDAERQTHLAAHARQVRDHIRTLGAKEYWKQFQPAPEMVVMFLPIEPLMAAAFERDGQLLEVAASLRVIPASPMTLLAILRSVAYAWQQQAVAHNAEEIQQLGRELYERLATMVGHFEGVGAHIKQAADDYDRFIGSLEQKVVPAARRFKELGVSSSKEVETPTPLNLHVRRVKKSELTAAPIEAETTVVAEPEAVEETTPALFRDL